MSKLQDIFIIGGGINGCGIARDAAGRGYSVTLAEMGDLASGTSSASSKLIHGGFRYLEHYEFGLVRKALSERETLLKSAPHIIWPMRFVLPHHNAMRPAWLLRLGLFLYDHIGKRKLLPGTTALNLKKVEVGRSLKDEFVKGFEYSDCWVNDARLVVLNAMDARAKGADIQTQTKVIGAKRDDDHWVVTTKNLNTGKKQEIRSLMLINASGPWVDQVLGDAFGETDPQNVRMVQGSHIVVPRIHQHDRAYIFQNADERIIFVIPYEDDFSLIGTTDHDYNGDPSNCKITPSEIAYLCNAASEYFKEPVLEKQVVWSYAGVRPLYDDGASAAQEATRDFVLKEDDVSGAPMVNIFGGKITTYRELSETMLELVEDKLGAKNARWTEKSYLPGGDFSIGDFEVLVNKLSEKFPFLDAAHARRMVRLYGTKIWKIFDSVNTLEDLGANFGVDLFEVEVRYLMEKEWAQTADDVLWRRTKRGLRLSKKEAEKLDAWMKIANKKASV